MKQKNIGVYTCNRSEYSRLKSVLSAIKEHSGLNLQIVVGGSHLLERYGYTVNDIENDNFAIEEKIQTVVEGTTTAAMAKSTGLAIIGLTTCFLRLKLDVLLVVGDRYDMLPSVITASFLNIPIAHIQGGEKTGTIDESIRHAVTKLSHLHFPATQKGKELILKMDEMSDRVFVTGCPSIDILLNTKSIDRQTLFRSPPIPSKVGNISPSPEKDYLLLIQHPVTTEASDSYNQMMETLKAIDKFRMQTILIYPNLDAGSDDMISALRRFILSNNCSYLFCFKHIPMEIFINLMRYALCMVGNSSAGIRESCYFGVPCVNIGTRQKNREHGQNVVTVDYNNLEIEDAINKQLKHGKYPVEYVYGDGKAGKIIADILFNKDIEIQK